MWSRRLEAEIAKHRSQELYNAEAELLKLRVERENQDTVQCWWCGDELATLDGEHLEHAQEYHMRKE